MIQSNNVDATIFDEAKGEYFENAYVAFLDILGFKSIVNNNAIPIIVEIINSIIKNAYYSEWAIHYATYRGDRKSKYAKFNQCLRNSKIYSFSDSIIMFWIMNMLIGCT